MNIKHSFKAPAQARGLTLIELMISIFLGLLIIGAALTVFTSNRQTYRATESLGRIQENSRTAFELMSRDIREAAGNACEQNISLTNVLNAPTATWYTDFSGGIRGYDGGTAMQGLATGTGDGQRIAGTDAIELKSSVSNGVTIQAHPPGSSFKLNTVDHGLSDGDIVMVCNFEHAAIFQISNVQAGVNVVHNTGNSVSPGNNKVCLSPTGSCDNAPSSKTYSFGCLNGVATNGVDCPGTESPATMAQLRATRWFIGNNPRGGRSLYQSSLQNISSNLSVANNEIVEGVRDLQLTYLQIDGADYLDASAPPDWSVVSAVRIELTFEGDDRVGVDGAVLQRQLFHTVALRNRAP